MTMEKAQVVHLSTYRVRLRIPGQKGNAEFFMQLESTLSGLPGIEKVEVNPRTASVLILHSLETSTLTAVTRSQGMFDLTFAETEPLVTFHDGVTSGFRSLNSVVTGATAGRMSLWDLGFLALLGTAIYQLSRGNIAAPAWYTALWYSFNTFLKSPG